MKVGFCVVLKGLCFLFCSKNNPAHQTAILNPVELLVLPPASIFPASVLLCARKVASVMMVLSSMATGVCHNQPVDVLTKDAICKMANSSGMVRSVTACVAVMAPLGQSIVCLTSVVLRSPAVW